MRKKIYNQFIKFLSDRFGEDIRVYWADEEGKKHWHMARRHGYKKSEMHFYYSDLIDSQIQKTRIHRR